MSELKLGIPDLSYADLFSPAGLQKLDSHFCKQLAAHDAGLHQQLLDYRNGSLDLPAREVSEVLISIAGVLEEVIASCFKNEKELEQSQLATLSHQPVLVFKKLFVQRRARRRLMKKEDLETFVELDQWLNKVINQNESKNDRELAIATLAQTWLADKET